MNVLQAIGSRRSIRRFQQREVEPEKLNCVVEAARWAPSWKNSQCVRLIVVEDAEIRKRIAGSLEGNRSFNGALEAPVLMVLCAEMGLSGNPRATAAADKPDWYMFDAGLYAQNFMLAAHHLGLGSVTIGNFDSSRVGCEIGLPKGYAVVSLLLLGYPAEQPLAPPRKPIEETVYVNRFGKPFQS